MISYPQLSQIVQLPVEKIHPNPEQPRKYFDREKLDELKNSILAYGVIQPLTVRKKDEGYELVAGERRLRAARSAGLLHVPCIIIDVDEVDSAIIALAENIHRQDLDFIEEAESIYQMENVFGLTREEIAQKLGKSRSAIANKLRILNLPGELLFIIRERGLSERHARALLRLESDNDRVLVLQHILNKNLTVSDTERYIERYLEGKKNDDQKQKAPSYKIRDIRLFLNTVDHGIDVMKRSGISASYGRNDTDTDIILTISIPKKQEAVKNT